MGGRFLPISGSFMGRTKKIFVVSLLILSFSTQLAYANSFSDFWTKRKNFNYFWKTSVPNWANKNKTALAFGPAGFAVKYAVKAGNSAFHSREHSIINSSKSNNLKPSPLAERPTTSAILAPRNPEKRTIGKADVATGKSKLFRPWVTYVGSSIGRLINNNLGRRNVIVTRSKY